LDGIEMHIRQNVETEIKNGLSGARTTLSRRAFSFGTVATLLSTWTSATGRSSETAQRTEVEGSSAADPFDPRRIYAATTDNGIELPAVDLRKLKPELRRCWVAAPIDAPAGSILVRLSERYLYFFVSEKEAIRYGVGIGGDGFAWTGRGLVDRIKPWPNWTPPPEMVVRVPELKAFKSGMPGGITNPLGARALYISSGGKDTLYRIHGTPEWWTIGKARSSGCIRLINQDVIDLASRTSPGTQLRVE
jgi:lipoprotein-anchoring transpeptidase ErfK/SrfK